MKTEEKFLIGIPNWDKHQKKMSRRSRDWIAISTEMLSDPYVRELPAEAFKCWIGILLHAGKVGVPFKFCASSARVLFGLRHSSVKVLPGLRHSSVLSLLAEQGLITLSSLDITRQDITIQDKTVAHDAPTEKQTEPKVVQKAQPAIDFYEPESYPPALNVQAWKEWVAYRKTAHLPKYKTFKQMDNLAKYPMDVQAKAVDASITQGYTGVFPEKFFSTKSEKQMQTNINAMQEFLNG